MTADPASATGSIRAAYSLKSISATPATTVFIGLDVTNGATPAAMNTAKANGSRSDGVSG